LIQYGPRKQGPSKLDPYKALIRTRLAEFPKLTAKRLFAEVQTAGYPGGYVCRRQVVEGRVLERIRRSSL
jgi:transposase